MTARYSTPMTEFTNYVKTDPEAPGPRITPAALITPEARDHIREFWKLPDAQVGMWILMLQNGEGFLMTDSNFQAKYERMHTTA